MELAAVASAAVPGLIPTAVAHEPDDSADFDAALLVDSDRRRWRVRSPRHPEASARLETEREVLRAFSPGVRAELPFVLPTVAGTVRLGELTAFVYSHVDGAVQSTQTLSSGGAVVAKEVAAAMAAIHELPAELVERVDLPVYSANEFRQRRLNELDQAATTGKIPSSLLRRWEQALEDTTMWNFAPTVVHGDLHEDNLLFVGSRLTAVTGWTDLRVGDPADDFAWLTAVEDTAFVAAVREAYAEARTVAPDRHLQRRAALSAEFALAQWLVRAIASGDTAMIADAEQMLRALERDIALYGGQQISAAEAVTISPAPVSSTEASGPSTSASEISEDAAAQDGQGNVPGGGSAPTSAPTPEATTAAISVVPTSQR